MIGKKVIFTPDEIGALPNVFGTIQDKFTETNRKGYANDYYLIIEDCRVENGRVKYEFKNKLHKISPMYIDRFTNEQLINENRIKSSLNLKNTGNFKK